MLRNLVKHNGILSTRHGWILLSVFFLKAVIAVAVMPELYVHLFVPFLKKFVSSGYQNPWNMYMAEGGQIKAFPYGTGMLVILSIPFAIKSLFVSIAPDAVTRTDILLMNIPVLLSDVGMLYLLVYALKLEARKSVYIYWCSPVVLYICYYHGQLDILPMLFLVASLVLLINHRLFFSALVLGIGIATKENLLLVVPFMLIYALRKERLWLSTVSYIALSFAVYAAMIGPVFSSPGYEAMVLGAEERSMLFMSKLSVLSSGSDVLMVPLALGLLYLKFCMYGKLNKEILIMYVGLAFAVLLLFIPADAPGWYMWLIPFLCYYYINSPRFHIVPYIALSGLFILYFLFEVPHPIGVILPGSEAYLHKLLGSHVSAAMMENVKDTIYTLLAGTVAFIVTMMYIYGVRSTRIYKERTSPIIVGVGGNSSAGKDTLCDSLKMILGPGNVIQAEGDDFHRWERGHYMWREYTHLNPKANDLFLQFDHARSLSSGRTVVRRVYDHGSGRFSAPKVVEPNKYIFVSGLHPFYIKRMRELIDIKIFLDTEEQLRNCWKIKRDMLDRGYTKAEAIDHIRRREEDGIKFIEPQKVHADIIIRYETAEGLSLDEITEETPLRVKIFLDNSVGLDHFVKELGDVSTLEVEHWYEDVEKQGLSVTGSIQSEQLMGIIARLIPDMEELVDPNMRFENGLKGVTQAVFICALDHFKRYGKN